MAMRINRGAPYIWRFLHVSHPNAKLKRLCFFPGLVLLLVLLLWRVSGTLLTWWFMIWSTTEGNRSITVVNAIY